MITERADTLAPLAATFRAHGFSGASLAVMSQATGLDEEQLLTYFPGGKDEMAEAVLERVSRWFATSVNEPLRAPGDPAARIETMFAACQEFFDSRSLVCLFGAFSLGQEQQRYEAQIRRYFDDWTVALTEALQDGGWPASEAADRALDVVAGIQGALIIGRAFGNPQVFASLLEHLRASTVRPSTD